MLLALTVFVVINPLANAFAIDPPPTNPTFSSSAILKWFSPGTLPLWRVPLVVSSSLSAITREIVKCAPRISTEKIEVTKETKKSEISRIRKQGDRFLSKRKENDP